MKQSQLFTKTKKDISSEITSINAQLLTRAGFIDQLTAGVYTMLPLGLRVLQKVEHIIREEMNAIGGQEILMPTLQPKELWEQTDRWDHIDILFKLTGSGDKEYTLGSTHEEVVTPLLQKFLFSYKDFPTYTYQIQTKFRDEARAKSGLLRGREFRMKDLYSFHTDQADLDTYYVRVTAAYHTIYKRCGLGDKTIKTYASGGAFSKYSHEFQTLSDVGEDHIYVCHPCNVAINKEIIEDLKQTCPECGNTDLEEKQAIEVGNIFKLGTKFTDAFGLTYANKEGKEETALMGCYGIGPSRVIGTIVEVHHDDNGIIWPAAVAPFQVHLISLCRDEDVPTADALYAHLTASAIEVLYDERQDISAGQKFADSDLIGIPIRIVISKRTLEQHTVEIKKRTEEETHIISIDDILTHLGA